MSKDIHKWTEGRYTLMFDEHTFFVWDNEKEKRMTALQVTKKLNEQDKEIGLLRLELDTHKHPLWSTREAEEKVNKLADNLADEVKKNGLLNEEINQLKIENMRLKKKGGDGMSEKRFVLDKLEKGNAILSVKITDSVSDDDYFIMTKEAYEDDIDEIVDCLNEQQFIINELRTYNLQHFLEWLVIKGYVTDEPMKDINNVIDCVNKFKEYLTELDKFKEYLEVLEDE